MRLRLVASKAKFDKAIASRMPVDKASVSLWSAVILHSLLVSQLALLVRHSDHELISG